VPRILRPTFRRSRRAQPTTLERRESDGADRPSQASPFVIPMWGTPHAACSLPVFACSCHCQQAVSRRGVPSGLGRFDLGLHSAARGPGHRSVRSGRLDSADVRERTGSPAESRSPPGGDRLTNDALRAVVVAAVPRPATHLAGFAQSSSCAAGIQSRETRSRTPRGTLSLPRSNPRAQFLAHSQPHSRSNFRLGFPEAVFPKPMLGLGQTCDTSRRQ
jgi:hypothetical protein